MCDASIEAVKQFWNANPCDSQVSSESWGSLAFFREITADRYDKEWHIPGVARFDQFRNKRVLEIGCGVGADACEFVKHAARYTGVDLTLAAVQLTTAHLKAKGLNGHALQADAERLPFGDKCFDHIYSFGAIHHSPNTEAIVKEMHRVLVPNGTLCIMVYHKHSINYWVEIRVLRKVLRYLLIPSWSPRVVAAVTGFEIGKVRRQRAAFLSAGAGDSAKWLSMNTDGPDCPLAKVYTRSSARRLFAAFEEVECHACFFNKSHYPLIGRLIPRFAEVALGRSVGWHLVVTGRKAE